MIFPFLLTFWFSLTLPYGVILRGKAFLRKYRKDNHLKQLPVCQYFRVCVPSLAQCRHTFRFAKGYVSPCRSCPFTFRLVSFYMAVNGHFRGEWPPFVAPCVPFAFVAVCLLRWKHAKGSFAAAWFVIFARHFPFDVLPCTQALLLSCCTAATPRPSFCKNGKKRNILLLSRH